jgi:hypothetical protein
MNSRGVFSTGRWRLKEAAASLDTASARLAARQIAHTRQLVLK